MTRLSVGTLRWWRAVRSLEDRGLVVITKEHVGWKGAGEYGRLTWKWDMVDDPDGEYTRYEGSYRGVPQEGDKIGGGPDHGDGTHWILGTPVKYSRKWYTEPNGMPTVGLLVWLPDRRAAWLERREEHGRKLRAIFGQ